jgi:hypothetical protein
MICILRSDWVLIHKSCNKIWGRGGLVDSVIAEHQNAWSPPCEERSSSLRLCHGQHQELPKGSSCGETGTRLQDV